MLSAVHLYKDFPPVRGGIEGHVGLLTAQLASRGVATTVLCSRLADQPKRELRNGVDIQRCTAPVEILSTPLPPGLPLALRRCPADLVHLHSPWPPAELAYWLAGRRRPLVVSVHCEAVRYPGVAALVSPLTQRVLGTARAIVVGSEPLAEIAALARHRDRVVVLPYGVDLEHFRPDPHTPDPLPAVARPRVLFVGRLRHYKGLDVIAAALAQLPDVRLVVIGDGPSRTDFERALAAYGCADRAHLLGEIDDAALVRQFQHADAAVLASTSRAEAFGLSIAEAQACGVPAVTTELGTGTARTVDAGRSGRVVAPRDPRALADALRWCLRAEGRAERRAAARDHAERSLGATAMADRTLALYREITSNRKR